MAAGARRGIKVVHAPRGMLGKGALTFSAKRKRLFWHILQKRAAAHVDCWHATSEKEIEDIRNFGLRQPIALVPNGIDIPPIADLNSAPREKTILFLGRIHPKKGIDTLLQAWADLEERFPDWQLDIAGPADNAYGAEYKAFIQSRGLRRARLIGPLYGDAKSLAYERAAVFVLPTLDENFGLTVAEALVRGTPAIVSQGAPWAGLTEHDCGWWHPIGEQPLRDSMREAMQCGADVLKAKGRNGRKWVKTAFGWPALASQMSGVYDWLAGQSDKPDCVFID
jgi:glycosyltransferase involved in cell wall biosynthesis